MKQALLLMFVAFSLARGETLTTAEREKAINHFEATRKAFLASVAGLSEAQWNFKPAPDKWSVAETAEHIAISEDFIFQHVTGRIMKGPEATPEQRAKTKGRDDETLKTIADRSKKAKAPEPLMPARRWASQADLIDAFNKSRDRNIAFIRDTQEDLRSRVANSAIGLADAYQFLLVISAHSERHTAQINEVKAHADFPKQAASARTPQFLVLLNRTRPTFPGDLNESEKKTMSEHLQYLKGQIAERKVVLAGPRLDGAYGVVIVEAASREEAERIAANDPAVKAGLFKPEVHPFRVALMRN